MNNVYWVYAEGREFGADFLALAAAQAAKRSYQKSFPSVYYYIRKARCLPRFRCLLKRCE